METRALTEDEMSTGIRTLTDEWPRLPYFAKKDPKHFSEAWKKLMRAGVARSYGSWVEGKIVGILLGLIVDDMLSGVPQATHCVWQVMPEYRKRGIGTTLLKRFEEDAKEAGCKRIIFGADTNVDYCRMRRFYRHQGYKPANMAVQKLL